MRKSLAVLGGSVLALGGVACQAAAEGESVKEILCPELVEVSNQASISMREMGQKAADQVSAGEKDMAEETCVGDIRNIDFSQLTSFSGSFQSAAIQKAQSEILDQMRQMVCDAAQEAVDAANTAMDCNAAVGVQLDANASFEDFGNVEECGGLDLEHEVDESVDIGEGGNNYGGGIDEESEWDMWADEEGGN